MRGDEKARLDLDILGPEFVGRGCLQEEQLIICIQNEVQGLEMVLQVSSPQASAH